MINNLWIHPALILIFGALLMPLVPRALKKPYLLLVPILTFIDVFSMQGLNGVHGVVNFLDTPLVFGRIDSLSTVFAYIMSLMCIIGTLYGLNVEEDAQHIAAWLYAAGSLGVILCGDYLVLFLFWELMAFASVFLIWFRRTPQSQSSGYRYLLVHTAGGLALLAGLVLRYQATGGDLSFNLLDVTAPTLSSWLILIGFLLNAAAPPLHAWLPDAYSEATFNGSVFLCAFTTKTAVYVLARGFAGMEILIPIGVCMALYGIVYALLQNDARKLLAYDIIAKVGFMVAAVGIGSNLAINGVCALAFAHILYKSLLFMGCGSVLHMTGTCKLSELGGLYRKMPLTLVLTLVGCLSISAFPFFSGFTTKAMIMSAMFEEHKNLYAFLLMAASAGTFLVAGLKLPYFIWFGKEKAGSESFEKAADPPANMLAAMAIAAFFNILIGCYTPWLYKMLPFPALAAEYHAYSGYHISETLQILAFTGLAFYFVFRKLEPKPLLALDLDLFYRMIGKSVYWFAKKPVQTLDNRVGEGYRTAGLIPLMATARFSSWFDWNAIDGVIDGLARTVRGTGGLIRSFQSGRVQSNIFVSVAFVAVLIAIYVFA
jgi:multicomponent Na+:H+ antiporter subunit D